MRKGLGNGWAHFHKKKDERRKAKKGGKKEEREGLADVEMKDVEAGSEEPGGVTGQKRKVEERDGESKRARSEA